MLFHRANLVMATIVLTLVAAWNASAADLSVAPVEPGVVLAPYVQPIVAPPPISFGYWGGIWGPASWYGSWATVYPPETVYPPAADYPYVHY